MHYFPSFEVISSAQSFGQYLASDLREVTDRGIGHVMELFRQSFVAEGAAQRSSHPSALILGRWAKRPPPRCSRPSATSS